MERFWPVAPDRMNQAAAFGSQRTLRHATQLRVIFPADMFEHADRHEGIVGSTDVPVIIFDKFDPALHALLAGAPAGELELLLGNVEGPHFGAIAAGNVQRQAS